VAGAVLAVLALLSPVATGSGTRASRTAALAGDDARLYAMGRYYWNLRTAVSVRKSIEYFTRVIEREPESPFGYVGMADANVTMGDYCYGAHRPSDYFGRARAYVREALVLDPRSVPAHATLGFILLHERKPLAAIAQLHRAVEADPAYGPARQWYAIALARENRVAEAWVQMRYAADLQPLSVSATAWLGSLADRRRNFGEGRVYARELRDMVSDFQPPSHPRGHPTWASIEASAEAEIARGGD
jgi:tetratricopeptide (TPR) repeat protein